MRITKIKVNNFKSLVDFEIDLSKFNCIVGLNGSGKSTFLQFIDFLRRMMSPQKFSILNNLPGPHPIDFYSKLNETDHVEFQVDFECESGKNGYWHAVWVPYFQVKKGKWLDYYRCVEEKIEIGDVELELEEKHCRITSNGSVVFGQDIAFQYEGSILSQLEDEILPEQLLQLKKNIASIHSFQSISPLGMRSGYDYSFYKEIGPHGEDFKDYFRLLDKKTKNAIIKKIKLLYPSIMNIHLGKDRDHLIFKERYGEIKFETEIDNINDGLLRMLVYLTIFQSNGSLLLFDEIENGINQELVEFLVKELVEAKQQIVVTTHSGLFLNYLDDDLARDSVQYFYKTPEGFTQCKKFFSIPSTAKKLGSLGPGEAVDDTNLYRLNEEIEQLDRNKEKGD